jgi:nicotinate-nucleotide pyrophosphorylase (carboxylating)
MLIDFVNHPDLLRIIKNAFDEDIKDGDHTTLATIPKDSKASAKCLVKDHGILAGIEYAKKVFQFIDPTLELEILSNDGDIVQYGDVVFFVHGNVASILQAERIVLNGMQRMSGIATQTYQMAEMIKDLPCKLLDTRKTTPSVRLLEKWAVHIGGGKNHRMGLYDMIMIKDNHTDFCGGIQKALERAKQYLVHHKLNLKIEVETRNLEEVKLALETGIPDIIMLDNMPTDMMKKAVEIIGNQCITEASGNITIENLREKALTGVNFISCGSLTHSYKSLDISLKIVK